MSITMYQQMSSTSDAAFIRSISEVGFDYHMMSSLVRFYRARRMTTPRNLIVLKLLQFYRRIKMYSQSALQVN